MQEPPGTTMLRLPSTSSPAAKSTASFPAHVASDVQRISFGIAGYGLWGGNDDAWGIGAKQDQASASVGGLCAVAQADRPSEIRLIVHATLSF